MAVQSAKLTPTVTEDVPPLAPIKGILKPPKYSVGSDLSAPMKKTQDWAREVYLVSKDYPRGEWKWVASPQESGQATFKVAQSVQASKEFAQRKRNGRPAARFSSETEAKAFMEKNARPDSLMTPEKAHKLALALHASLESEG